MDDKTLFDRIKHGDSEAFELLMFRYHGALFSFASKLTGENEAAKDAVQESFVTLWIKRHGIVPEQSIKSFLYILVRNNALKYLRKKRIHGALHDVTETRTDFFFIENEKNRLLSEAINRLPKRTAEVIKYSREGLPQQEIARQMGITVATVKLLKSHGLGKLRELLRSVRCWIIV